jgi:hypothetical protein
VLTAHSDLSPTSRAWVFQADRKLYLSEKTEIERALSDFCREWNTHGDPLPSNFEIREDRFVILYADESHHSIGGCSIDGSTRVMKSLQHKLNVDFFDRTQIPFWLNGELTIVSLKDIKPAVTNGLITPQTEVFNTMAATQHDLKTEWKIPMKNSWLARYLRYSALSHEYNNL